MNIFNGQGDLSAMSKQEAFQQIYKLASILQDGMPTNLVQAGPPSMSEDQRNALVDRALWTQEGKVALAQVMSNPILN